MENLLTFMRAQVTGKRQAKRHFTACLLAICLLLICACPAASADTAEKAISFTTLTLDGKEITSDELFQNRQITVINVWATWCNPCIDELEDLSKLHTKLQKLGCGVVGILWDGDIAAEEGRKIAQEKGVNYPILLPGEGMDELTDLTVFPTTFFVDSKGHLIGEAIAGARVTEYEKAVLSLLPDDTQWADAPADTGEQSYDGGYEGDDHPATADADLPVPEGMMIVCEGDVCYLIPIDSADTSDADPADSAPTPEDELQTPEEDNYPTCPVILEYISETEVVMHAAGEYTGMDNE